ncbi:calpain-like cysteine peptidase [Strigomonas culicis]|uniref:Calpain-like cysteine peptidase n=1 Tax=Strigomonas culicis TaxID=28005 RepID=S9VU83_9TRYP|nr:calpain-like cysteine peptidase [Strigomonas culicis]|eukprot:EPY26815.1 calpain-like cysteine peptidase [Strigomonas culicis]
MTATYNKAPEPVDYPPNYTMPLPRAEQDDAMHPVRVPTPLPDLLPRNMDDIKRMRKLQKDGDSGKKHVEPRRDLPPPYVNDEECDEFEDKTIDTTVLNLSEKTRGKDKNGIQYHLSGPSIEGDVTPVFENGMLFKVVAADGTWYYYNDSDKYEMHVKFTFGAKSDLEPGEDVEMFVQNNNEFAASLVVFPGATSRLVGGKINGFKCSAKAVPLSDEKREEMYGEVNDTIADQIAELADAIGCAEEDLTEEQVLLHCEQNEIKYVDCDFRPCDYSLYRPDLDTYLPRFIPWYRPSTWIPAEALTEVRLFRRDILPSQVTHGSIGDTYLVSAMACLAEHEDRLHDIFRHPVSAANGKVERAIGAYWATVNLNGWWLPVLLDDYLPATRDGPEFSRCSVDVRRMWVALLEKTYAKVHGSYANIASGDPLEPLTELTGFPITRYDGFWEESKRGEDTIFQEMLQYFDSGYLQVLCTPSDGGETFGNANVVSANPELESKYEKMGLRLHHGYAVLQVQYFQDMELRLVQLRNPWGSGEEWNGAWSKTDTRWDKYQQVRSRCFRDGGSPTDTDRTFWMDWRDCLNIFCGGGCCHLRSPWFDYRIRGAFVNGAPSVSLEINVADPVEAYIVLTQVDERDEKDAEYNALLLSVFKRAGKKQKLDCTSNSLVEKPDRQLKFNFSRDVAMRYTFVPEDCPYYIVPRVHDMGVSAPYVIGFLPDTYVGNGMKVEFVKMDRNCKVFSNMPSFVPAGMVEDVATDYQIRNPRQPTELVGTELKDDRIREFGVYED